MLCGQFFPMYSYDKNGAKSFRDFNFGCFARVLIFICIANKSLYIYIYSSEKSQKGKSTRRDSNLRH